MKPELATIKISQPAHRALQAAGIETLEQLTHYTEEELLELHGFGPKALVILKPILAECGLSLKKKIKGSDKVVKNENLKSMEGEIMEENKTTYKNIDEYILLWPTEVQEILKAVRQVIKEEIPEGTTEKISWQMPTFYLHGNLVHFAANKSHLGLYPGASGIEAFEDKITEYKSSKGAVQFPYNKPMPYELIREIVRFRVAQNIKWAEEKLEKKKSAKNTVKTK